MPFTVLVDDNFHYMDESERYSLGDFATLEVAIEAARKVVDEYLLSAFEPGMTCDALLTTYLSFGEDPFIIATDPARTGVLFSARDYARSRCVAICHPAQTDAAAPDESARKEKNPG